MGGNSKWNKKGSLVSRMLRLALNKIEAGSI